MGKGDKKTKKGKIARGSYGKSRKHKLKKVVFTSKPKAKAKKPAKAAKPKAAPKAKAPRAAKATKAVKEEVEKPKTKKAAATLSSSLH